MITLKCRPIVAARHEGACLVVGTAKSGTTAMLYALRHTMGDPSVLFEKPLSKCQDLPHGAVAKIIFEHEHPAAITRFATRFEHRIMLLRDPRDNLISRSLYALAANSQLLRDNRLLHDLIGALRRKQDNPATVDMGQLLAMLDGRPGGFTARMLDITTRFAAFHRHEADNWHVVRYENMVAGNLEALSSAIGRPIHRNPTIDPAFARVARTRAAGDWRRWFTRRDVAQMRPALAPLLQQLGYGADWELDPAPAITPEHSWQYVLKLIDERRRHYGMPEFIMPGSRSQHPAKPPECNICGNTSFGPGPNGRMARNGQPPACLSCGALERQRILRAAINALPLGLLSTRRALVFGDGAAMQPAWFRTYRLIPDIADRTGQPETSADFILLDHALEYIEHDRRAFNETIRLLTPRGVLLVCFSAPESRASSEHFKTPAGARPVWHRYGADLVTYFNCAEQDLGVLRLTLTDPCTNVASQLYLFFKDRVDLIPFRNHVHAWDPAIAAQTAAEGNEKA